MNCLTECEAFCCKPSGNHRIVYDFTRPEVRMIEAAGGVVSPAAGGGFIMPDGCVFLIGNRCVHHGLATQPLCCRDNVAGDTFCLRVRRSVSGRRYGNTE